MDVRIDPGQAFGTGAHATTTAVPGAAARARRRAARRPGPLVDLGTGSGVLGDRGRKARLGARVSGCDSEPAAIEAAAENAAANGVELVLERVNLREQPPPTAPVVVANLTAPLLEAVAERFDGPPATLVCSGLLVTEIDRVGAALGAAGLERSSRSAPKATGRRSWLAPDSGIPPGIANRLRRCRLLP